MKTIIGIILATQALSLAAREIETSFEECSKNQVNALAFATRLQFYNNKPLRNTAENQTFVYQAQYVTFQCFKTIPKVIIETKEQWVQRQELEDSIEQQKFANWQQQRRTALDNFIK